MIESPRPTDVHQDVDSQTEPDMPGSLGREPFGGPYMGVDPRFTFDRGGYLDPKSGSENNPVLEMGAPWPETAPAPSQPAGDLREAPAVRTPQPGVQPANS